MSASTSNSYIIRGGNPISGTVIPSGNKNAALPLIACSVLATGPVALHNVPAIRDVDVMLELLEALGTKVTRQSKGTVIIDACNIETTDIPVDLARRIRASFLLAGPLAARWGRATLPRPGGDRIGRRPLDTHIHALTALGVEVEIEQDQYTLKALRGLTGADIFLHEASVMATENAVMAAALAVGTTTINNAASEPHVQELCRLIESLGAHIDGIGTNALIVHGCRVLGSAEHTIGPDHVEVGSFIGLAAVTGGELLIKDSRPIEDHRMTAIAFARMGIRWEIKGDDILVPGDQELRVEEDLHGAIPKIDDGPWPAFPADLTSIATVLATQARGTILIHEKMFESRLFWIDHLIAMGARIVLCDPHRVVVVGPCRLHGCILSSPDIRAGMALVIAALAAQGESVIHNIHQIERGYADLPSRLRALGADIEER